MGMTRRCWHLSALELKRNDLGTYFVGSQWNVVLVAFASFPVLIFDAQRYVGVHDGTSVCVARRRE